MEFCDCRRAAVCLALRRVACFNGVCFVPGRSLQWEPHACPRRPRRRRASLLGVRVVPLTGVLLRRHMGSLLSWFDVASWSARCVTPQAPHHPRSSTHANLVKHGIVCEFDVARLRACADAVLLWCLHQRRVSRTPRDRSALCRPARHNAESPVRPDKSRSFCAPHPRLPHLIVPSFNEHSTSLSRSIDALRVLMRPLLL